MRVAALVLVFMAASTAVASAEDGPTISVQAAAYGSPRVDVLAGDTVTWRNDSVRRHTTTAADGSWTSDSLGPRATFSRAFDVPGAFAYYCRLHPFMRGEVDVHRLLLDRPAGGAAPNRPFELGGRAALPAGTAVVIETDSGERVASATVETGGTFRATVLPAATASYRAVAGGDASPPVQVAVVDRRVEATAAGRRVNARVLPAAPGAKVALQLHLRERFGWWTVERRRVDAASRARFDVRRRRPVRARVVLLAPDGLSPLATSRVVRVRP